MKKGHLEVLLFGFGSNMLRFRANPQNLNFYVDFIEETIGMLK